MQDTNDNLLFSPTSISEDNLTKRKFLAEAGIHIYSGGPSVFRPKDLYLHGKNPQVREALLGSNIYIIARRKRISVAPDKLRVTDGKLYGDFLLHGDEPFSFERFHFSQKPSFFTTSVGPQYFTEATTANSHGYEVLAFDTTCGKGCIPAHALVAGSTHKLSKHTDLEVLYVGQSYGQTGNRLAIDRLATHSTLQRILAESADECPNDEVLLLMFRFEFSRNILSTAGDFSIESMASSQEEHQHLQRNSKIHLDRKTRITVAEAALINYFKPRYNILHKDSFNTEKNKKLATLKKLFAEDLTALIVEVNTASFGSKIFSRYAPTKKPEDFFSQEQLDRINAAGTADSRQFLDDLTHAHIARFPLYRKSERETFLHSLPWFDA